MDLATLQHQQLRDFAAAVQASPHNLVSRRAREELLDRHVPECVAFAALLPRDVRILDIGSGGGFPAIVIALTRPDLDITMIEATGKKVQFLQEQVEHFGLTERVRVLHGRAEEHQEPPLSGSFDVVTARAVAPFSRLIGWSVPFLRPGGLLYAIKGERWAEELEAALEELRRYGANVLATPDQVGVDRDGAHPRVVIIQRSAATTSSGPNEGKS